MRSTFYNCIYIVLSFRFLRGNEIYCLSISYSFVINNIRNLGLHRPNNPNVHPGYYQQLDD